MWFAAVLAVLLSYMLVATLAGPPAAEHFAGSAPDLDQRILEAYQSVLQRNPTGPELVRRHRQLTTGEATLDALRRELKGGDEYLHNLKLQSDGLMPELPRIVSDRDLMNRVAAMYKRERRKELPGNMLLPLRDAYMILNYDDAHFIAFLRQKNYADLELAVANDPDFDRDDLVKWMRDNVDSAQLDADAAQIQKELDAQAVAKGALSADDLATIQAMIDDAALAGGHQCAPGGTGEPTGEYLRYLQAVCQHAFDKDGEAPEGCARIKVPTHVGNPYVLRPEFAWSVPHPQPPVCTSLGQPSLVQPTAVFTGGLLLGTTLGAAEDTAVGSLLPKFDHQQYVEARPTAGQCRSAMPPV
jgi:hypothetical protein